MCSIQSCPLDTYFCLGSSTPAVPTCPRSAATSCGPCRSQGLGGLWIWPRCAWFPPSDVDIDIALAALLKGLPGINAEELDDLLKDLPMPEPGAKGGISVKEAAEVCCICYIPCYIISYITCYWWAARPFARDGQGSARPFHWKWANYARFCQGEEAWCYIY